MFGELLIAPSANSSTSDVLIIINFGHPMTDEQKEKILQLTQKKGARIINCPSQFDLSEPLAPQVTNLVSQIELSTEEWQTHPIVVVPPGLSPAACVVITVLHGLMGYFPSIVRLVQAPNTTPPKFVVQEIINLADVRNRMRKIRTEANK